MKDQFVFAVYVLYYADSGGAVAAVVDDGVVGAVERVSSLDRTLEYFDRIPL